MTVTRNFLLALLASGLIAVPGYAQYNSNPNNNQNNQNNQSSAQYSNGYGSNGQYNNGYNVQRRGDLANGYNGYYGSANNSGAYTAYPSNGYQNNNGYSSNGNNGAYQNSSSYNNGNNGAYQNSANNGLNSGHANNGYANGNGYSNSNSNGYNNNGYNNTASTNNNGNSGYNNNQNNYSGIQSQPKAASSAQFLRDAAENSINEIEIAKLAEQRATDANIRQMAQHVVNSETANLNRIHQVASQVHVNLPVHATALAKAKYDELASLNGQQFNQAFLQHAVAHHVEWMPLFREQAQSAQNPTVRAFAQRSLSMEQQHLQSAENTANQDGISLPGNAGQMAANFGQQ